MSENTTSNATVSAQAGAVEQDILLDVQHLTKRFAADTNFFGKATSYVQAVDDVSFQIRKGEAFGLVGESGCGKTTVGKMLVNLLKPTSGKIVFDGKELTAMKPAERKQYCHCICGCAIHGKRPLCVHHTVVSCECDLIVRFLWLPYGKVSHRDVFCQTVHVHPDLQENLFSLDQEVAIRNRYLDILRHR